VKHKLTAFFVKEKAKGRLTRQASEECLADFCIATIQGAMLMGKIRSSSQTAESTLQKAVALLKSYLVKPNKECFCEHDAVRQHLSSLLLALMKARFPHLARFA
jgi:hypothetical protein